MKLKVEGLKELDRALGQLPKATARGVLRRVAKGALQPMADDAQAGAPVASGDLKISIAVSEKRTRRAKQRPKMTNVNGKWRRERSKGIEMAMGPAAGRGVLNYATFEEFGSVNNPPRAFMRAAWARGAMKALDYIKSNLGDEIRKTAERVAKRKAKRG